MHSLASSRCCRAASRRVASTSPIALADPDPILSSTLDRFCRLYITSGARNASSVPGPLESRRRNGRRHMGELGMSPSAGASFWDLENTVDLSQWRWFPPRMPGSDHSHRAASTANKEDSLSLAALVTSWLHNPASSSHQNDPFPIESTLHAPIDVSIPEPQPLAAWVTPATAAAYIERGQHFLHLDLLDDPQLKSHSSWSTMCANLTQDIASGRFCDVAICDITQGLRAVPSQLLVLSAHVTPAERHQKRKLVDGLNSVLLQSILQGLSRNTAANVPAWNDLLLGLSELRRVPQPILAAVMRALPHEHVPGVSLGILAVLDNFFLLMGRRSGTAADTFITRETNVLMHSLRILSSEAHSAILDAATRRVLELGKKKTLHFTRIRWAWLRLLARMPQVTPQYLAETCCQLEAGTETPPLSPVEICKLFLATCDHDSFPALARFYQRLDAHSRERSKRRRAEEASGQESASFGTIASEFWRCGHYKKSQSLYEFLRLLGREQDCYSMVAVSTRLVKNEMAPLVQLALGLGNPHFAMEMMTAYARYELHGTGEFWKSVSGGDAIKGFVVKNHKDLNMDQLLRALRLPSYSHFKHTIRYGNSLVRSRAASKRRRRQPLSIDDIAKIEAFTEALIISKAISNRTALSYMNLCVRYLGYHSTPVPPKVFRALLFNVTRDLADGKPGRTQRLRWFLKIYANHAGDEAMEKVGERIAQWRERNCQPQDVDLCLSQDEHAWGRLHEAQQAESRGPESAAKF